MDASQIRVLVSSMTSDDRHLLEQNISLIQQSNSKEDLQSFITFIDPLAMAPAIANVEICKKLIANASLLTADQLRVVIALTTPSQIKDIVFVLEDGEQVEIAVSMIDKRDELVALLKKEDIPNLNKKKGDIVGKLKSVKEQLVELDRRTKSLSTLSEKVGDEYELLARSIKNTKTEIENLQQISREIQVSLLICDVFIFIGFFKIAATNHYLQRIERFAADVPRTPTRKYRSSQGIVGMFHESDE